MEAIDDFAPDPEFDLTVDKCLSRIEQIVFEVLADPASSLSNEAEDKLIEGLSLFRSVEGLTNLHINLVRDLEHRFKSGNSVPVDRAVIPRQLYVQLREALIESYYKSGIRVKWNELGKK